MGSEKYVTALLVVAVLVSVGGTFLTLSELSDLTTVTGFAANDVNNESYVNLTVANYLGIDVNSSDGTTPVPDVNFGTGYVDATETNCTMTSEGTGTSSSGCKSGWAALNVYGVNVTNVGNKPLNVNISSGKTASGMFDGTLVTPLYQYKLSQNLGITTCDSNDASTYMSFDTTTQPLCGVLNTTSQGAKPFRVDFKVLIPQDTAAGSPTDIVTFIALAA